MRCIIRYSYLIGINFILENPHERTIQIICGILFLPVIVLAYLLIEENFNYKTPFVFFIIIYVLLYKTFCSYYIKRKKWYGNYKE